MIYILCPKPLPEACWHAWACVWYFSYLSSSYISLWQHMEPTCHPSWIITFHKYATIRKYSRWPTPHYPHLPWLTGDGERYSISDRTHWRTPRQPHRHGSFNYLLCEPRCSQLGCASHCHRKSLYSLCPNRTFHYFFHRDNRRAHHKASAGTNNSTS